MVRVGLLVLVAHVGLLRSHLDLVEDGDANQETDGKSSVQPVVLVVEPVGELHHLSPQGVGVRKRSSFGHREKRVWKINATL